MLTKLAKGILLLKLKVADTVNFTTDINFCILNLVCNDFEPQASSGFIFILNSSKKCVYMSLKSCPGCWPRSAKAGSTLGSDSRRLRPANSLIHQTT